MYTVTSLMLHSTFIYLILKNDIIFVRTLLFI